MRRVGSRTERVLIVEADGARTARLAEIARQTPHGRAPPTHDRLRDALLAASGLQVVRITWRPLVDEPMAVAARIARTLALTMDR